MKEEKVNSVTVLSGSTHLHGTEGKAQRSMAKTVAITGITAALYFVVTLAIAPIGYGAVQFRISEITVLLAFIDPFYSFGLILGCLLSNLFSPIAAVDIIFGTLGTVAAVAGITRCKSLFVATLMPTLSMIIVTIGISLGYGVPYFSTLTTVMVGEFAVVTCLGYPIFKVLMKNKGFIDILKIKK